MNNDEPMSILEHLDAMRRVILISVISIIPGSFVGWYIREDILNVMTKPVTDLGYKLVYIGATEAFTAQFKLAIFAGIALATPVIAYQFWRFLLPALHSHERRSISLFVPLSVLFFAGGIAFGYYSVFMYGVQFLLSFGGEGLTPMLSLGKYISFTIWFLLPFGLMFELPLVVVILARRGLVTYKFLAAKRKWALLLSFIISGFVTPTTDMFTQGIMGGAMYLLFEISIWLAYIVRPKPKSVTAKAGKPETAAAAPDIGDATAHDATDSATDSVERGDQDR